MPQLGLFAPEAGAGLSRALDEFGAVTLHNRKYLGSKVRLLDFIEGEIVSAAGTVGSFFDGFAGTGVVAGRMRCHTGRVTLVDTLASNYSINRAFFTSNQANVRIAYVADCAARTERVATGARLRPGTLRRPLLHARQRRPHRRDPRSHSAPDARRGTVPSRSSTC